MFSLIVMGASLLACGQSMAQQSSSVAHTAVVTPEMKQMQHIEDLWSDAVAKRDQYGLELVLSPQLVDISSNGEVTSRNQQIARVFLKDSGPLKLEQKVATVRMFGDVAVVSGTYIERKKESAGVVDEKGIFTHVFERVRSNWQCVNSQRTIVLEQAIKVSKSGKKSNSELPLHVPLVYKGADAAPKP